MNQIEEYYNLVLNRFGQITTLFGLITIIVGFIYRKYFNKPINIVFYFLIISLVLNALTELFIWSATAHYYSFWKPIFEKLNIWDSNFFNGFFYLTNIVFIGMFYFKILPKNYWIKYFAILLAIFQIFNYFFIDGFRNYGVIGVTISDLFIILLPCFYLWDMSSNPPNISVLKNSYFWISMALFLPHLFQIIITFTASDLHKTNFVLFAKTHVVRNIFLIISQILFIIAFTKAKYLKYL